MRQNLFAGIGLGLLVGLLLGLSVSNTVGGAIAALTGLLAVFFGLNASVGQSPKPESSLVRITAFSFACVFGVMGGISFRTHGWLSPTIKDQVTSWKNAGYDDAEAKRIVKESFSGSTPRSDSSKPASAPIASASVTGLFDVPTNWCVLLNPDRTTSSQEFVTLARSSSKDLSKFLDSAPHLDIDQQADVIRAAYKMKCQ